MSSCESVSVWVSPKFVSINYETREKRNNEGEVKEREKKERERKYRERGK